jgi:hypothetical protein
MNLIKKIKNIFSKKKNVETPNWNDYKKDYWFPNNYSPTDVIGRMFKLNKIYKKERYAYINKVSSSMIHYSSVSHPVRKTFTIPVRDTALDKGFKRAIGKYSIAFGSSNTVTSGYNNHAYGYSAFPVPINEIRIKKLTKIFRKDS